ncbi:MAG: L-rhamnose mutarotase [Defluviitaleaceae bacterium]|nr:L-rhamnose mutarotase [Defluviitaleaceae bacterium]
MINKAFKMQVFKDSYEEYARRHDALWPEMREMLQSHGVREYSIFLDNETGVLFAHAKIESEKLWDDISKTDICKKWWEYMADIMATNPDSSPQSTNLDQVFNLV